MTIPSRCSPSRSGQFVISEATPTEWTRRWRRIPGDIVTARSTAVPVSDCACRSRWAAGRSPASRLCGREIHLLVCLAVLVASKVLPCGSRRLDQLSDIPVRNTPTPTQSRDNGKQHTHSGVSSDHRHRGSVVSLMDILSICRRIRFAIWARSQGH